ncbi:DUF4761 family protein [Escherichia coli]|nr:DUF4761 family protein [Escherichia coli]
MSAVNIALNAPISRFMVLGCIPCSILDTRSSVSIVVLSLCTHGSSIASLKRSNLRRVLCPDFISWPWYFHHKSISTWLIEKAGIVVHRCQHNPFTGNRIFALSNGDNQFGQDFTLYEALRTVDRLLRGQSFIKQTDL